MDNIQKIKRFVKSAYNLFIFNKSINYALYAISSIFLVLVFVKFISVVTYIKSPLLVSIPFVTVILILITMLFFTTLPSLKEFILYLDRKINSGELLTTILEMQKIDSKNPYFELMEKKAQDTISKIENKIFSVSHKNAVVILCISLILFVTANLLPSQEKQEAISQMEKENAYLINILEETKNLTAREKKVSNKIDELIAILKGKEALTPWQDAKVFEKLNTLSKSLKEEVEAIEFSDKLKNALLKTVSTKQMSEKEIESFVKERLPEIMGSDEFRNVLKEAMSNSKSSVQKENLSALLHSIDTKDYREFQKRLVEILKTSQMSAEKKILFKMNVAELDRYIFNIENILLSKKGKEYTPSSSSAKVENIAIKDENSNNVRIMGDFESSELITKHPEINIINLPDTYKQILKKVYEGGE